ncbi:MAG: hypothetical protein HRU19_30550, partial [Pseudobacteriovorax sp.]|nr:hypothetical protein [Pseudobacteriovorax sp.]
MNKICLTLLVALVAACGSDDKKSAPIAPEKKVEEKSENLDPKPPVDGTEKPAVEEPVIEEPTPEEPIEDKVEPKTEAELLLEKLDAAILAAEEALNAEELDLELAESLLAELQELLGDAQAKVEAGLELDLTEALEDFEALVELFEKAKDPSQENPGQDGEESPEQETPVQEEEDSAEQETPVQEEEEESPEQETPVQEEE